MDQSTLLPVLSLFTLLTALGFGVYRLVRIRAKIKRDRG